jgi:hypothetical protein
MQEPNITNRSRVRFVYAAISMLLSALVSYVLLETLGRLYLYYSLHQQIASQLSVVATDDPASPATANPAYGASIYDPEMGYSYRPNVTSIFKDDKHDIRFHINSWGHVSDHEYPLKKPGDEYRIVVVGDSFAAGVTCKVRWPAVLEQRLQASREWLAHVGGKRTRVINVARDGIGLVQFDKVLVGDGLRFDPDMVIVSFVTDALPRKPYFRGNLDIKGQNRDQYVRGIASAMVWKLPWFSPYPEFVATQLGLQSRLAHAIQVVNEQRYYSDKDQAARISSDSIKHMLVVHNNVHILLHPDWADGFHGQAPGYLIGVMEKFLALLPGVPIEFMIKRFPAHTEEELQTWFLYPYDLHPSDLGETMYGNFVFDYLMENLHRGE